MVKATHKPPARIRYEQSHPTVSFRLDRDTYTLLKQRLLRIWGVSAADFIKESLGLLHTDIEEIKQTAWNEGYDQAVKEITFKPSEDLKKGDKVKITVEKI